jgi:hypothetical protein
VLRELKSKVLGNSHDPWPTVCASLVYHPSVSGCKTLNSYIKHCMKFHFDFRMICFKDNNTELP